ncbi:hypothetical protein AURDEDRAFT_115697 [Auricularia subglabra TFB-10046 SS5]|uniref:Uncharacterized protein n=1 Tax=Auricularia subglabra (strain TFB-10046 / SS5) TaxID=717982 RepID=J0LJP5_AURST|nr:hypothetical protein AURDEDRAFT_115697 [Auricularia subglabra TFB-10046 SS5]
MAQLCESLAAGLAEFAGSILLPQIGLVCAAICFDFSTYAHGCCPRLCAGICPGESGYNSDEDTEVDEERQPILSKDEASRPPTYTQPAPLVSPSASSAPAASQPH